MKQALHVSPQNYIFNSVSNCRVAECSDINTDAAAFNCTNIVAALLFFLQFPESDHPPVE